MRPRFALVAAVVSLGCLGDSQGATAPLPAGGTHVLFIGNSLTYVNDLPRTVEQLAALTGDTVRTRTVAKPDYALIDHVADGAAAKALRSQRWDVVVMQQGSSALDESRVILYQGVDSLLPLIHAAGARPALYEVWPMASRSFDAARVRESYRSAAVRVNGLFYPAGSAWQEAWARDASLELLQSDGLHPTPTGTFLAALVMVEQLTGRDVRALPTVAYAGGRQLTLAPSVIRLLQDAAHAANARGLTP